MSGARWLGLWIAVALAVAPAPADARGGGFGAGHGRRGPPPFEEVLERHAERLGLDAAARDGIRAVADGARPESERLREQLRELRAEMRELLEADSPDVDAVMRQAERIGEAETAAHKQRLRTMLQIRALLTPEQREELVRIHEEGRARRRGDHPPGDPR